MCPGVGGVAGVIRVPGGRFVWIDNCSWGWEVCLWVRGVPEVRGEPWSENCAWGWEVCLVWEVCLGVRGLSVGENCVCGCEVCLG